jgi:hypothetical protein
VTLPSHREPAESLLLPQRYHRGVGEPKYPREEYSSDRQWRMSRVRRLLRWPGFPVPLWIILPFAFMVYTAPSRGGSLSRCVACVRRPLLARSVARGRRGAPVPRLRFPAYPAPDRPRRDGERRSDTTAPGRAESASASRTVVEATGRRRATPTPPEATAPFPLVRGRSGRPEHRPSIRRDGLNTPLACSSPGRRRARPRSPTVGPLGCDAPTCRPRRLSMLRDPSSRSPRPFCSLPFLRPPRARS